MDIFNSTQDLRVSVRTPDATILDTHAMEVDVEDTAGTFTLTLGGEPALSALMPSTIVLRRRDGSIVELEVGYGTLTAVGNQVRMVVDAAKVRTIEAVKVETSRAA